MASARARAWASCSAERDGFMEVPRISGVDYSAKRLAAALCTKIPPNFETPTRLSRYLIIWLAPPGGPVGVPASAGFWGAGPAEAGTPTGGEPLISAAHAVA